MLAPQDAALDKEMTETNQETADHTPRLAQQLAFKDAQPTATSWASSSTA